VPAHANSTWILVGSACLLFVYSSPSMADSQRREGAVEGLAWLLWLLPENALSTGSTHLV